MIGKGKAIAHTQASVAYGWNQEKGAEVVFKQELLVIVLLKLLRNLKWSRTRTIIVKKIHCPL